MSALKIVMFIGSCRTQRMADRVAKFVNAGFADTQHEVKVFDPNEMPFELLKCPLHFYPDQSAAPEWLREAGQAVKDADAYVVISAEYNATIPPALSNMMDHFAPASYSYKPAGICTYSMGSFGGIRAGAALRPFLSELGSVAVPMGITIPTVQNQLDADGKPTDEGRLAKNLSKFVANVEWYGQALKKQREAGVPS